MMLKNLLLYRLAIFNSCMAALLGYLGVKGYVAAAIAGDPTGLTLLITFVFILLWGATSHRAWKTAIAMNNLKEQVAPDNRPWTKRLVKIAYIHDGASWLAYLGLIGTVIGFVMALGGIDISALDTDVGVKAMIPELMIGMKVALFTTLSGAFFCLWTEVNYRMLHTATKCLVEDEKARWDE